MITLQHTNHLLESFSMNYLVAYDISNDKNRKKLGDIFEEFGY